MTDFFYDSWTMFLAFILSGVLTGIIYDVFRILRIARTTNTMPEGKLFEKIKPKKPFPKKEKRRKLFKAADKTLIFFEDILFWLTVAVIQTVFIYYFNNGEVRLDFFFYSALGFGAYMASIGKFVVFSAKKIIFLCRCLIFYALYIIMYPIRVLFTALSKVLHRILNKFGNKIVQRRSEKIKMKLLKDAECGFGI